MRVLLLGGTGEARSLAAAMQTRADVWFVSSLAGRVRDPALPLGRVRIGGFGGVAGLERYLLDERIDAVVDATHPFAATITVHAVEACAVAGVPLLVLRRPGWTPAPGDDWRRVPDIDAAARTLVAMDVETVFLTTGRRDLAVFADDSTHRFLVRAVDEPVGRMPPRTTLVLDRGPYTVAGEAALMAEHGVDVLVTKNSGGQLTVAKLIAARERRIPVIVVDRPALPVSVHAVESVEETLAWITSSDSGGGYSDG